MAASETQPSHQRDWDTALMSVNVEDKSEDDNDLYESLRGVTQSQLKAAKQARQASHTIWSSSMRNEVILAFVV